MSSFTDEESYSKASVTSNLPLLNVRSSGSVQSIADEDRRKRNSVNIELEEVKKEPTKHHHHHHHHHAPTKTFSTKAKKIELAKKIGRVVYTILLLTIIFALVALDVVTNTKGLWISRCSIVIAVTLFGRWIYEFFFEIFYEWMLDYFIPEDKKPEDKI